MSPFTTTHLSGELRALVRALPALSLSFVTSVAMSAGCSLLGTTGNTPEGLPHNGVGPFRDLLSSENGLARPGSAVGLRGLASERPMQGGLYLFYAAAAIPMAIADAGMPDAGDVDAGPLPDAGPMIDAGPVMMSDEIDWAALPEARRIYRSPPRPDSWGYEPGAVVLAPEGGPAWEGGYVTEPWALPTNEGALLYYVAAGGIGVARASSIDGAFSRVGDGPITLGGGSTPRCPTVVETTGLGIAERFLMMYEVDGTLRTAVSMDGVAFTDRGPITLPALARRDSRDGEETSIGCPGASVARPTTGRRFVRMYYESRRDNGATLLALAATVDGATFEPHPVPVVNEYDRRMPAPRAIDARLSVLLQWAPRRERTFNIGELRIGMAPGGTELPGGTF